MTWAGHAEACEQKAVAECQHALKVFKFKKYKEGYEVGKRGVSMKYSLDIGSFLMGRKSGSSRGQL